MMDNDDDGRDAVRALADTRAATRASKLMQKAQQEQPIPHQATQRTFSNNNHNQHN
jgi:hypothetical protein